jgi:hypothetical protein
LKGGYKKNIMKIRKKITLISLMLGVMLVIGTGALVSAADEVSTEPYCNLVINEPQTGAFYDPITITWSLEGNACNPLYYTLQYNTDCDAISGWQNISTNLDPKTNPMSLIWSKLPVNDGECGQYCLRVNMIKTNCDNGCCSVTEKVGPFSIDLAKPEVELSVGDPRMGDCEDGEGTCYVNQETPISLSCTDENPDKTCQSGVDYIEYRYAVDDEEFTDWETYEGPFNFEEDTNHVLQYRCFDNVGKVDSESKDFIVETMAPEITRTVSGPQVCPEEGNECEKYFNLETEICVSAVDPEPHPSDNVKITCSATVRDYAESTPYKVKIELDEEGCFNYKEDSFHTLECTATDALGNSDTETWMDIVDAKAPMTTLSYTGPHYTDGESQWIDGVSRVVLSAIDPQPHPVEGVITKYRYSVVDDKYCYGDYDLKTLSEYDEEEDSWTVYTEPFGMEESCHLIEYYSTDALGNAESIKQEFVFVDKTKPETSKEVGKPSHDCDSVWEDVTGKCEEGWDWIVTTDTPIYLSCNDVGPHPSGVDELCYKITWDGVVTQNWKCVNPAQFENEKVPVYFYEECEHTLEFYCVDHVNKTSDTDVELFKVEGTPYPIPLDKKWNLISFPFNLLSNDVEEVFNDASDKIKGVWSYENGEWKVYSPEMGGDLKQVVPGRGYWVKTTEATTVLVGGELISEGQVLPPSVELDKGWNLIGHYGTSPKPAYCSLFSLVDTQEGFPRWSALWGYNTGSDDFFPLGSLTPTFPGKGYWVEMDVQDEYSPATTCWGMPSA